MSRNDHAANQYHDLHCKHHQVKFQSLPGCISAIPRATRVFSSSLGDKVLLKYGEITRKRICLEVTLVIKYSFHATNDRYKVKDFDQKNFDQEESVFRAHLDFLDRFSKHTRMFRESLPLKSNKMLR